MLPIFKTPFVTSKHAVTRTRLHASLFAFVRQARASGLETDWINLISGKTVEPARLEKLDQLIVDVLKNPSAKEFDIDTTQPWAELRPDPFTNRNVIQYEIPRATRERLRDEALKEAKDEAAAKELYRQKLAALRNQLIRRHAIGQTEPVLPPLKVAPVQTAIPPEAYEKIEKIKTSYPNFMAQIVDKDANLSNLVYNVYAYPPPAETAKKTFQSFDEGLRELQKAKSQPDLPPLVSSYLEATEAWVQTLVDDITRVQELLQEIQTKERSPFDPDYGLLLKNPHISKAYVEALRKDTNAKRKLFYVAQTKFTGEVFPALHPKLYTLARAVHKYLNIANASHLAKLDELESFAIFFEKFQAHKYVLANFRMSDSLDGLLPPELKEHVEKQMVNNNFLWDYYNPTLPTLPIERKITN